MRKELNVSEENKDYFDFIERGSNPHTLLGLKNGSLLAEKLSEEAMVELKVKQPFLSPNLQVWSTPINSKLLITGSLGVDPYLVEPTSNYPRFSFLVKKDMLEESIEEEINKEVKELETILDVKFKKENESEEKCLSFITDNKEENDNHFSVTQVEKERNDTTGPKGKRDTLIMNTKKRNLNHFSLIPVEKERHGITEECDTFLSDQEET